jgi:hypothetical protein
MSKLQEKPVFRWYYTGDFMETGGDVANWSECHLEFRNPITQEEGDLLVLTNYRNDDKMWSVDIGDNLSFLFDCGKKFRKLERAQAYVLKELKRYFAIGNLHFSYGKI